MKLLVVRHGETDWNAARRYQGQQDMPLNQWGQWQAQQVARTLAQQPIARVVSSDLQRAQATARATADVCGVLLTTDARWRELNFGAWEGLTYQEIVAKDGDRFQQWAENPALVAPPGGETLQEVAHRVQWAWQEMEQAAGETAVLVAHAGSLQLLVCHLLGLPATAYWQFQVAHGSIGRVEIYPAGAMVVSWNETHHLQRGGD